MTMGERTAALSADRTGIERAIEGLYAAGLELQVSTDGNDVTPCVMAIVPGCVQRISELMTDLRKAAECPPAAEAS